MSFPWGIAAVVGLGALGIAALSSSSSSAKKAPPKPADSSRFSVRRGAGPGTFALADFSVGDLVSVVLDDSTLKTSAPAVLKVTKIQPDGLVGVYEHVPIGSVEAATVPPVGTFFAVFPKDVLSVIPAISPPGTTFKHTMTDLDLALTPSGFAAKAGFESARAFVNANPGLSITPATAPPFGMNTFGEDSPSGPIILQVNPWEVGLLVNTKIDLGSPGLGPTPFGGGGFGSGGDDFGFPLPHI